MKSMSIRLPDNLMEHLVKQSSLNHRSKNKHIEHLLAQELKEIEKTRCNLGSTLMCHNGIHNFKSFSPVMNEFCQCQMFVYGEIVR